MARIDSGSVHGRFQPFHNGHLDYVLQAAALADHLFVGLTQLFRPLGSEDAQGRDSADANPLTFHERSMVVTAALEENGIPLHRFTIVPFPIENPARLTEFIPVTVPCFTTLVTEWNDEKVHRLREVGYQVRTLQVSALDNNRVTSGTEIRRLLRNKDSQWARYVPSSVAEIIGTYYRDRF